MHSLKNVFVVSYESRILCKIKWKSKKTGVQKIFMFSFPAGFCKGSVKRKDCCAKIYFFNVYKNVC